MEYMRNAYKILVGRPERKRPLERHKRRWQDVIKIALKETGGGFENVDWIHMIM
jgi:hypothetical protein